MENTIKGKKIQMSQLFLESGVVIPVTLVSTLQEIDKNLEDKNVEVVGTSKGKGFTGVMKKWGFHGEMATRGQSNKPRSGGSIGSQTPGRVLKGKKMAGRMGGERVTVKNLHIISVNPGNNELEVSGQVPGTPGSLILVHKIKSGSLKELEHEVVAQVVEGEAEAPQENVEESK